MTAREHARRASEILAALAAKEEQVANLSPDEHLQMVVQGGYTRLNKDAEYSVSVATAHALAALAVERTFGNVDDPVVEQ